MKAHSASSIGAWLGAAGLAACVMAIALGGCGSQTKTVSISSAPPKGSAARHTSSTARVPATKTASTPRASTDTTTSSAAETGRSQATRTGSAPAFTKESSATTGQAEAVSGAVALVKAHGFTAEEASDYHPNQTLQVLVGTRTGSNDGYDKQAFFFIEGRYIGTDASQPSANVKVVAQSDTEVTLAYTLYKPHDPLCCATGGEAKVRFQLNNGKLVALDPIPPVSSSSAPSRQ